MRGKGIEWRVIADLPPRLTIPQRVFFRFGKEQPPAIMPLFRRQAGMLDKLLQFVIPTDFAVRGRKMPHERRNHDTMQRVGNPSVIDGLRFIGEIGVISGEAFVAAIPGQGDFDMLPG